VKYRPSSYNELKIKIVNSSISILPNELPCIFRRRLVVDQKLYFSLKLLGVLPLGAVIAFQTSYLPKIINIMMFTQKSVCPVFNKFGKDFFNKIK